MCQQKLRERERERERADLIQEKQKMYYKGNQN